MECERSSLAGILFPIPWKKKKSDADVLDSPKVEPQEKKKTPKGRAKKRLTYTRRFVNVTLTGGKRKVRFSPFRFKSAIQDVLKNAFPEEKASRLTPPADEPQPRLLSALPTSLSPLPYAFDTTLGTSGPLPA